MSFVFLTSSNVFISEMIYRDPSRIQFVIYPTMYQYQLAVYLDESLICHIPAHLKSEILHRVDVQRETENNETQTLARMFAAI